MEKDPKFKVGDPIRISKYKNNFAKGYTQLVRRTWSEELFIITEIKLKFRGPMLLVT